MPDSTFDQAMYFVEISEGGTNDDPDDRGGLTKHGISEKQYPHIDIENLTPHTARHIYYNDYWLKNKCDSMRPILAIVIFDTSVNCGQSSAAKWLQETINMKGSDLEVDGIIGPLTIASANMYDPRLLSNGVLAFRLIRYHDLLKRDHTQYKFIRGWIKRVADLIFYTL